MSEAASLEVETHVLEGGKLVKLAGEIGGDLDPAGLGEALCGDVVVSFDGIRRVTSPGVRRWLEAISHRRGGYLGLAEVRPTVAAQLTMVAGFGGGGEMLSAYLPDVCEGCGEEFERLHTLLGASRLPPERQPCRQCGRPALLDDDEGVLLGYSARSSPPAPPPWVEELLEPAPGEVPRGRLRIQMEVMESLTGVWLSGEVDARSRFQRSLGGLEGTAVLVFAGVEQLGAGGAKQLASLVSLAGDSAWWARVRPQLLSQLPPTARSALQGRVYSALIPARCRTCEERGEAELVRADVAAPPGTPVRCRSCGAAADLLVDRLNLRPLEPYLAWSEPEEVRRYLEARPGEPAPVGQTKGQPPSRYEVLRSLGVGGMAEVVLARQRGARGFVKTVALKRILPPHDEDEMYVGLFLKEARIAARISHPNVVQIFDLGEEAGRCFLAMEYVPGWDLDQLLRMASLRGTPLPPEVALRIGLDMLAGLHAAHTCVDDDGALVPVIHRDVSPHNVLVSRGGVSKLTDFGVSVAADVTSASRSGHIKGKVAYLAPERLSAELGPVDARADLFAAALVLYEMLTLVAPFKRKTHLEALRAVLETRVRPVEELRPDVSPALAFALAGGLTRLPDERYPSAPVMARALEQAAGGVVATADEVKSWLQQLHASAPQGGMPAPSLRGTTDVGSQDVAAAVAALEVDVEDL